MSDAAWGIESRYRAATGEHRQAGEETLRLVRQAMGVRGERPSPGPATEVMRPGDEPLRLAGRWELHTEDGAVERVAGTLPPDLPIGYHRLFNESDGRGLRLVVSPGRCHLPDDLRTWGWAVQLYAARSSASWGIGDLADLRRIGQWSASLGAGMVMSSPLHAVTPVSPVQRSPYYPTSRCFWNPLFLRVEEVPGASEVSEAVEEAANAGRALNAGRAIDHDAVLRLKLGVLERIWSRFSGDPDHDRFVTEGGEPLAGFGRYCALAETFGPSWHTWPPEYRHPSASDVAEAAREHQRRVGFHCWLQWLLERQVAAACERVALVQDLAVGVDPGGADAWLWQDCIAPDIAVGAPPDEFNVKGQDWGLPAFDPWKLRDAGFDPFIRTVRAGLRAAGGLRVDHVMGLFRLYWIPAGSSAADGAYVRYPSADLLDVLAIESHRAGAFVVGEDLGTVEEEVRDELAARRVLSYRLVWFESEPPPSFPEQALAAVTTHDLPTVAGLWTGSDVDAQRQRDMAPNVESAQQLRERLRGWTGVADDAPVDEVVLRTYDLLGKAPSAVLAASLDDVLGVEERANYPGTVGGTNWSLALPVPLDDLEDDPRVRAVAAALDRR